MNAKNKMKICLLLFAVAFWFSFTALKLQTIDTALTKNQWKIISYKTTVAARSKIPKRLFEDKGPYLAIFSDQNIIEVNARGWGRFSYELKDKNQIEIVEAGIYPTVSDESFSESDMDMYDLFLKTTNHSIKGDTLFLTGKGQIRLERVQKKKLIK
ncbi:MAG: hypothetical protein IAF38_03180, partial [Bacteroidia bacterium]|nr:hypothetical protein [Bacteroidia bacterium]